MLRVLAWFLVAASTAIASSVPTGPGEVVAGSIQQEAAPQLDEILVRLSRVARLYADAALAFACEETIVDTRLSYGRPTRRKEYELAYVYVFEQLSSAADPVAGLLDYRTDRATAGTVQGGEEIRLEDLELSMYLKRAYSWVFIFGADMQPLYEFRLEGEDEAVDREAVVVAFEARPPYRRGVNEWVGRAWVDRETYQLLKVEAMTVDDAESKALADRARSNRDRGQHTYTRINTEFAVEKNGMRFPSKVSMVGTWSGWVERTPRSGQYQQQRIFTVDQTYENYSFFSTRVEGEVRAFVLFGRNIGR